MLNLQFFHTRTYPYYPKQVPYSRAQRFPTWAYASQHNIQTAATPREVLGVSQDADIKEIKTAFRKLALKLHPDRETGSESEFIEVLRAYEILVGKADGKEGVDGEDWDFHDWFWRFSMNRSRNQGVQNQRNFRTDFSSQLAGLRQRAAVRAAKQRAERSEISVVSELENESCCDDAESPSDSGTVSEDVDFSHEKRSNDEARRRSGLNSSEVKESISQQLTGLKRRSQIRQSL